MSKSIGSVGNPSETKILSWRDIDTLASAIECYECGRLGPCNEQDHWEYAEPDVPCTCDGCSVAARGKWIAQRLERGDMSNYDIPREDIYDILVLARCDKTDLQCTERVPTERFDGCDCETCRAFARVDAWMYGESGDA